MNVDHLRSRRDLDQAAGLVADSFDPRHGDIERVFRYDFSIDSVVHPGHIRVVRDGRELAALVVIYEKTIRIGRARLKMGGLGFVCSRPRYRGRGLASKCLFDSVNYMKKNEFQLSMLFGIDRFYGRAGYVGCLPEYRLKVAFKDLSGVKNSLAIQSLAERDLGEMVRVYEAAAGACPASVVRTPKSLREWLDRRQWLRLAPVRDQEGVLLFREKAGRRRVRGYVVWRDGKVWEAAVLPGDGVAAGSILAWLRDRRKEDLEKEVVLPHGPQHPLTQYAMRFNHTLERSFSWTGGGMGRVIDIPGFLNALQPELEARANSAGIDGECHVHFTVGDAYPKGRKARRPAVIAQTLRLGGGHQFMLAHRPHYWLRMDCSTQTLLQLALGSLPLATLTDLRVEGERNLLPVLFPESAPELFALDHF